MMTRLLPALLLLVSACAAAPRIDRPLTVQEAVRQARDLDGEEIVVRGWIEYCHRLSCPLFASPDDVRRENGYFLSIGTSEWFDAFAEEYAPGFVTLRARLNDRCIDDPEEEIITVCADRSNSLAPIRIVR